MPDTLTDLRGFFDQAVDDYVEAVPGITREKALALFMQFSALSLFEAWGSHRMAVAFEALRRELCFLETVEEFQKPKG